MKIAVEGCGHGELDKIYETIQFLEGKEGIKVDLLLCCGDFQSVRNESDLECMAVPKKYRTMNTFYKYYSGEKTAPILTIFIGGNHEASNYLAELPYGGWVCPNIYYMGYASVLSYGGVRIGGLSGIYKPRDFRKGHHEAPPYSADEIRSAYHIRNLEVFRLKQIKQPMDIMMSHDWPRGVYRHGNQDQLIRNKPFMKDEILTNTLGSEPTAEVLSTMKPAYWFSAHLHVKFAALVKHQTEEDEEEKVTKFLSLDKCLPKRDFLQVVDIPTTTEAPYQLTYDPEWLAIVKETNFLVSTSSQLKHMPAQFFNDRFDFSVTLEQILGVRSAFDEDLKVPQNFVRTVPAYNPTKPIRNAQQPRMCVNPQTTLICTKLGITDPCVNIVGSNGNTSGTNPRASFGGGRMSQGDESTNDEEDYPTYTSDMFDSSALNPSEISLDDDGESDDEPPTTTTDEETTDTSSKKPAARLSLSLPPVKGSSSEDDIQSGSASELVSGELCSPIGCSSKPDDDATEGLPTNLKTSTPMVPRVIKRRNLDIYATPLHDKEEVDAGGGEGEEDGAESKLPEVLAVPVSGGRKMIKRRNQAMYNASEEDAD